MNLKLLFSGILAVSALCGAAQINGNGYYRVQNHISQRYVYVTDNRGSINYQATTADVNALQLWKRFEKASSDPATIIYFEKQGKEWDLKAQNTGVHSIINIYVSIFKNSDGTYMCYAKNSGMAKYLADIDSSNDDMGIMSADGTGDARKWRVTPVTVDGENYFGIAPTLQSNGKYYTPFFTSFPYSAHSEGVKFYTVSHVDNGLAVIKEIEGTVAANTPVIAECSTAAPTTNRLFIGGTAPEPTSNKLEGVYFDNTMPSHYNRTKFDPVYMRALAVNSDGKLVYTDSPAFEFIPANQSYLSVPAGSPKVLRVVTEGEYATELAKMPTSISLAKTAITLESGASETVSYTILPATAQADRVTWTTSDASVATVSESGQITAVNRGEATVTVTTSNGHKASVKVTVVKAVPVTSITIAPGSANLYIGEGVQIKATVGPADATNKTITWESENPAVATVSETGYVTAVGEGSCRIAAHAANGVTGWATINVLHKVIAVESVTLSASTLKLAVGQSETLTATVNPDNADDKSVSWSSSNAEVATVDANGKVTAHKVGYTAITATAGGKQAKCEVEVAPQTIAVESVTLSQSSLELTAGQQVQLTATVNPANADNRTVTWTSSNPAVATVSAMGRVTAVSAGNAEIKASCGGKSAVCAVTVKRSAVAVTGITLSDASIEVQQGATYRLTATVTPENADDKTVTWASTDQSVATVDADGTVHGIAPGWAVIQASCGGYVAACAVNVTKLPDVKVTGITVTPDRYEATVGSNFQISWVVTPEDAANKSVVITSTNENIAYPTIAGQVFVLSEGTATIRVTTVDGGFTGECVINAVSGIADIAADAKGAALYDLKGYVVKPSVKTASDLEDVPHGIYILGGRKIEL